MHLQTVRNCHEKKEERRNHDCEFAYILAIALAIRQQFGGRGVLWWFTYMLCSEGGISITGTIKTQSMTTHQGQDLHQQLNLVLIEKGGKTKWPTNQLFCKLCSSYYSLPLSSLREISCGTSQVFS